MVNARALLPAEPAVVTRVVAGLVEPILTTVAAVDVVIAAFTMMVIAVVLVIVSMTPKVPAVGVVSLISTKSPALNPVVEVTDCETGVV